MKNTKGISLGLILSLGILAGPLTAGPDVRTFAFKLKIGGGLGANGDLGAFIDGLDEYSREIAGLWGLQKSGSVGWTNWGRVIGGEFLWALSPRISVGLGVASMMKTKDSRVVLGPLPVIEGAADFDLRVTPMTFSLYYHLPLSSHSRVYAMGGAGYYWGRIRYTFTTDIAGFSQKTEALFKDSGYGLQGGAGIEYSFRPAVALFAEVGVHLAALSGWEGDETELGPGFRETVQGSPVWYVDELYVGLGTSRFYPSVYFGAAEPENHDIYKNARPFRVNLSGLSFQAGVKINF